MACAKASSSTGVQNGMQSAPPTFPMRSTTGLFSRYTASSGFRAKRYGNIFEAVYRRIVRSECQQCIRSYKATQRFAVRDPLTALLNLVRQSEGRRQGLNHALPATGWCVRCPDKVQPQHVEQRNRHNRLQCPKEGPQRREHSGNDNADIDPVHEFVVRIELRLTHSRPGNPPEINHGARKRLYKYRLTLNPRIAPRQMSWVLRRDAGNSGTLSQDLRF